jgi:hypothetical protein
VSVAYLDMDGLDAGEYRVEMTLWPEGRLVLSQMGRRHETFFTELRRARSGARVAGLLAHGVTQPETFEGVWVGAAGRPRAVEILVYDTHLTLVPADGDPFQIPFGKVTRARASDEPHSVALDTSGGPELLRQLGRRRDACREAITARLDAHARTLRELTGQDGFADGLGVPKTRVRDFDALLARFAAPSRAACAAALLAASWGGEPRLGFVQLLDPDGETLASPSSLPERWCAFLLAPIGDLTALEVIAGPAAATYLFRTPIERVNQDLQLLHFRRAPLALTDEQASLALTNPHRLALRRLEPLRRLRASTVARLIHNEGWERALREALS